MPSGHESEVKKDQQEEQFIENDHANRSTDPTTGATKQQAIDPACNEPGPSNQQQQLQDRPSSSGNAISNRHGDSLTGHGLRQRRPEDVGHDDPVSDPSSQVYASAKGGCSHVKGCSGLLKAKWAVKPLTREDAVAKGLLPCKLCSMVSGSGSASS